MGVVELDESEEDDDDDVIAGIVDDLIEKVVRAETLRCPVSSVQLTDEDEDDDGSGSESESSLDDFVDLTFEDHTDMNEMT